MKNLTQKQRNAKEAYLNYQQEQMLAIYEKASTDERKAIIGHIDGFLSTCNESEKRFWLKFRRKLEVLNEKAMLFPLGSVYLTVGAREALQEANQEPYEFLSRHQKGDWGEVCEEDKQENEVSVREGYRILSAYLTNAGSKIWIVTESDRSVTTFLLPSEY